MLNEDPGVGLLAPAGTCVPLALHIDRNYTRVSAYQDSCEAEGSWLLNQNYIAGSMLAGRLESIALWIKMVDSLSDFEVEDGQTDGTLAHGLERTLCLSLQARGWSLVEQGMLHYTDHIHFRWMHQPDYPVTESYHFHNTL